MSTKFGLKDWESWTKVGLLLTILAAAVTAFHVARIVAVTFGDTRVFHEALEGAALLSVRAWQDGGMSAMYPADWAQSDLPLILTPYPPLFHWSWSALSAVMGGNDTFLPGRVLAVIALVGILVLIFKIAVRQGAQPLVALAVAVMFLIPVPVGLWAGVARVDIPAIFLSLLGLFLYVKTVDAKGRSYLWCCLPLALAGFTKQSLIAVPAAILLAELVRKRYDRALAIGAVTLVSVLISFLALNVMSQGGFFNATLRSLADEVFLLVGVNLAVDFFISGPVPILLTALTLVPLVRRRVQDPMPLLYLLTSSAVLAVTIGKPGANVNYYLEPLVALCIAGAVGFSHLPTAQRWVRPLVTLSLIVGMIVAARQLVPDYRAGYRLKSAIQVQARDGIDLPVGVADGPIIAPPWSFLLFNEPRPVIYMNDDYTFSVMAAWEKLFSGQRVIDDLVSQRVAAVVATQQVLSDMEPAFIGDYQGGWNMWSAPGFRDALFEYYERTDHRLPFGLLLYLPKTQTAEVAGG